MKTERKVLLMVRHGEHEDNVLNPESIANLCRNAGGSLTDYVREHGIKPEGTLIRHSDEVRTNYTGKAVIAGALGLTPVPQSQQDLDALSFDGIDIREDGRLSFSDTRFNWDVLKADPPAYLAKWLDNPNATTYDGIEITPYSEIIGAGYRTLQDSLFDLVSGRKDLGVLATHASVVEGIAIAAVNSARDTPVRDFDEIGGLFDTEDYATLVVDYTHEGFPNGRRYIGSLQRSGQE